MRNSLPSLTVALALGSMLVGSPLAMAQSAADAEGIVVYNAQHASLTQAWADAFTRETGIKVTLRKGSDTSSATRSCRKAPPRPADVFLTENSPAMALVDAAGLFAPLDADTLAQVPEDYPAGRRPLGRHRGALDRLRLRQDAS